MEALTGKPVAVPVEEQARREIESLIARARSAQAAIESYTQEQADGRSTSRESRWPSSQSKREALAMFPTRSPRLRSAYWGPLPTWLRSRRAVSSMRTLPVALSRLQNRLVSLPL